ncbi:TfoX/Sxy family protein [Vibrio sp. ZSDE26]|uniref:TfoX/Sxy family protein n=1 Tax=Vibrio amylolyticus TaxID=2847292 RepID=A0A9X1XLZ7_9VIBR|nr:TfoX/Sxy family protein [Vibrio amylolyticus]MCK6264926.1 TfoX/Sxy family protein [Vibrio amylolyticus]
MEKLRDLQGLGPKSEAMLIDAGIDSVAMLKEKGAIRSFIQVKKHGAINPSLNLLYALVGALEGTHWLHIVKRRKVDLIMQLEGYEELEALFESYEEPLDLNND